MHTTTTHARTHTQIYKYLYIPYTWFTSSKAAPAPSERLTAGACDWVVLCPVLHFYRLLPRRMRWITTTTDDVTSDDAVLFWCFEFWVFEFWYCTYVVSVQSSRSKYCMVLKFRMFRTTSFIEVILMSGCWRPCSVDAVFVTWRWGGFH